MFYQKSINILYYIVFVCVKMHLEELWLLTENINKKYKLFICNVLPISLHIPFILPNTGLVDVNR